MIRQSEFKMKFDPDVGHFTKHHIWSGAQSSIYGEGIKSAFKFLVQKKIDKEIEKY